MKFVKNCTLSAGVLALAAGLAVSQANAETLKGSFHLPFEAHWGRVVLEPGAYRISLSTQTSILPLLYVTGNGKTVMIPLGPARPIPESERSYLRVENIGAAHIIREFYSGATGKQITFSVPNSIKKQVAMARNAQDTSVPVSPAIGN
jgi:hypothetical protein